ncbi:hypothetical protein ES703_18227 [subsurface metagenome]
MENRGKKLWLRSTAAKIAIIAIIAFVAGYLFKSLSQHPTGTEHEQPGRQAVTQEQTWWTCSMHPQIRQPKPGKCPICFMDLIPIDTEDGVVGERQISFSEAAIKLMEIETTRAERKFVTAEIQMVGKIDSIMTKRGSNILPPGCPAELTAFTWILPASPLARATIWSSFTVPS